jgi:lysozyme
MKIDAVGLKLIKHFEGCRLVAYKCPAGIWTIGYGHTNHVSEGLKISQQQAEDLLKLDLNIFEYCVNKKVKVKLSQNQFNALVSFCYNVGTFAFAASTLLRELNQAHYDKVPEQLMRWNKAGKTVLAGLTKRRAAEAALFSTGKLII